jgi:hypothetical protein
LCRRKNFADFCQGCCNSSAGGLILRSNQDRSKKPATPKTAGPNMPGGTASGGRTRGGQDAGAALRSAYQQTVEEAIPAEMLDLLSKLD